MNADTEIFSEGLNCWTLTDIKTDNQLFEKEIKGQLEWDSDCTPLCCVVCNLEFFCKFQYSHHHLQHVAQPSVALSPIKGKRLKRLLAGKSIIKQAGPRSKTKGFVPQSRSPLKLTIKRLSTCRTPVFEVVPKKEKLESVEMDDLLPDGSGVAPTRTRTPSPTPSDILRQEVNADRSAWESLAYSFGFLAPETLEGSVNQEAEAEPAVNGTPQEDGTGEDSGSMCNGEPEPGGDFEVSEQLLSLPETLTPAADLPVQNGISDSEPEAPKSIEQESSDSGCEKDGSEKDFSGFVPSPTNPPFTIPKGLTILAPSAVNSTVVNGALPPEPLDSIALSEALSEPAPPHTPTPPLITPVKEGLIIKSAEALGATSSGNSLLNINTNGNNPLGLLQSYVEPDYLETCDVCGDRSGNLEQHRATMGHYKCQMVPGCRAGVFQTAADLDHHQRTEHNITPPVPPTQPSLQQLQQQVQRIPVPYGIPLPVPGMGTPPPAVSPGFRIPGGITLTYPSGAPGQPGPSTTPPVTGTIQARPFAMATSPSTMRADGSPVSSPALPAGLSRSISISTKPAQKRPPPSPVNENAKRSRSDSPDCELVDVQQPLPNLPSSISLTVRGANGSPVPARGGESSGVANILASRGITVTPAVNKAPAASSSRANSSPQPLTTLNLSSAVSIVPASQARNQFAVPQNRGRQAAGASTVTVDLTQDSSPSFRRNRPQRFTCQVCDKVFSTQETLSQHLATHRSPGKLPFKCTLCNAQYPNQQGLLQHKQTYHKEAQGSEMALPVVDMKHPGTMQKLNSLGIRHCLIMSQLGNSSGGVFGIPIVAIDNARNPAVCNLGALGACNVLSLGPAKALR